MIPRYDTPEMRRLWSDQERFDTWLEVELLAVEGWARTGKVPAEAAARLRQARIKVDAARVIEIENTVKHDIIAFLTHVGEQVGDDSRFLHFGMTSSDLIDTALAVLMRRGLEIVIADVERLREALGKRAEEHRRTPCMGRTHGVHAEPTTFGLKLLGHATECDRILERLRAASQHIAFGKLTGPVGTHSSIPPEVEKHVCDALDLATEPLATQVIPRDRHAEVLTALAFLGAGIERLAVELRHLQRTEVRETEEPFSKGQKGSSAMPHKRNPIGLENVTGLARLMRAYVAPALEDTVLWHERDISHSSVERLMIPDAMTLASYTTRRLAGIVEGLLVYPERMKANMESAGNLWASSSVLLALVETGLAREAAYEIVQRAAMATWSGQGPFRSRLEQDPEVRKRLSAAKLDELFDPLRLLVHLDTIFARCAGKER